MRHLTIIFVLAVLVVGCGSDQGTSDTSVPALPSVAGEWSLIEGVPLVDGRPITLTVEPSQLTGTAACNTYFAEYTLDGETVTMGAITRTEMGCEPEVMESESAYFDALARVTSMSAEDRRLILAGDGVELVFERL